MLIHPLLNQKKKCLSKVQQVQSLMAHLKLIFLGTSHKSTTQHIYKNELTIVYLCL